MKITSSSLSFLFASLGSVLAADLSYQPEVIRSENGLLEVTLDVDMVESLQGIEWSETGSRMAPGYNGLPVGPTLIVRQGDTMKVTLRNSLPAPSDLDKALYEYVRAADSDENNVTAIINRISPFGAYGAPEFGYWGLNYMNLHFHGMSLSFTEENVHESIGGGEEKTYTFELPEDQETGLYWYHNHAGGTAAYSYMASLMGFIEVLPASDDTAYITNAPGVEGATEVMMMMSEGLVNPDGNVPPLFPIVMQFNWTAVCNGHLPEATVYNFTEGEKALFRMTHAGVEPSMSLSIPDHKMIIVGLDGLPVPTPMEVEEIQLHGGQRIEFLVQFDTPGTFIMKRAAWTGLPNTTEFCQEQFGIPVVPCVSFAVDRDVATITVEETATATTRQALTVDSITLPGYSDAYNALAEMPSVDTKLVRLQQDVDAYPLFQIPFDGTVENPPGVPVAFGFNDRIWNPNVPAGTVTAGTCETWDVTVFPPGSGHPFHTHTAEFLVLKRDGVDVDEPYWRDTEALNENITIHVCFTKVQPGEMFLVHCHMPSHSDIGMMAHYEVLAADDTTPTEPTPTEPTPPSESIPTEPTTPTEPTPTEPTPTGSVPAPTTVVAPTSSSMVRAAAIGTWIGLIGAAFFY